MLKRRSVAIAAPADEDQVCRPMVEIQTAIFNLPEGRRALTLDSWHLDHLLRMLSVGEEVQLSLWLADLNEEPADEQAAGPLAEETVTRCSKSRKYASRQAPMGLVVILGVDCLHMVGDEWDVDLCLACGCAACAFQRIH